MVQVRNAVKMAIGRQLFRQILECLVYISGQVEVVAVEVELLIPQLLTELRQKD